MSDLSQTSQALPDIPATRQKREQWYRQMGWWQDERLENRYQELVVDRLDETAVVDNHGGELTHGQLLRAAAALAHELSSRGIGASDRVLIALPNRVEWQIALLAILRLRAIPASIPITTDTNNLAHAVDLIGCRLLIATDEFNAPRRGDSYIDAIAATNSKPDLLMMARRGPHQWPLYRQPGRSGKPQPPLPGSGAVDHIAFTSSTTGHPKAVMHSANTLGALNQAFTERFSLGPDQPIFMASPLGHSVGAYHGARLALFTGACLVLQDCWNPEQALEMIEQFGCAFTAAATPFLKDLVNAGWSGPAPKLNSLKSFLCGGAPVPPVLMEQARKQFPNTFVTNLWGMTEGGLVTSVPDSPREKIIATAGIGLPGLELQALDDASKELPVNREGELVMRGPGVFFGYAGQDDLYRSSLTPDGFFRTGDLARIDEQGYVQVTGRLKDLIVRGGVNIAPIPIEDVLSRHPAIESVAVIGFPDDRLGERICAVIQSGEHKPALQELLSFCREQGLTKRNCPEVIRFVRDMPRTAGGKIRKVDLRAVINENDKDTASTGFPLVGK